MSVTFIMNIYLTVLYITEESSDNDLVAIQWVLLILANSPPFDRKCNL